MKVSMKNANYTVEAVFVISICIWVLFALMYGSFYIHDHVILASLTREKIAEHYEREKGHITAEWESEIKKDLGQHLFLMRIEKVKAKKNLAEAKIQVEYELPISISGIKALFSKKKKDVFTATGECINPMAYKWDADLLRNK